MRGRRESEPPSTFHHLESEYAPSGITLNLEGVKKMFRHSNILTSSENGVLETPIC